MKMPKNEELTIQSNIVKLLRLKGIMVFSVPNGANFPNVHTRMLMMSSGLTPGVSDLIVLLKRDVIFLEVKTAKGKQSQSQKQFQEDVEKLGFNYHVVRSLDQVIDIFE